MVYDCFPFFNELELLELRLNELNEVVDRFVLVEATRTFQKKEKPLYYEENKQLFDAFNEKIIHVVVDEYPGFFSKFRFPTAWDYDNHQKDQVMKGLSECKPDDTIIISDLDEIPRAEKVTEYAGKRGVKVFEQRHCNFFLNCVAVDGPAASHLVKRNGIVYWCGSVMINYSAFTSFKEVRLQRNMNTDDTLRIEEGGWHFSFMGGVEKVRKKLDSWAHTGESKYNPEYLRDPDNLLEIMNSGEDLFGREFRFKFFELDESFPKYLLLNMDKYKSFIKAIFIG